MWGKRYTRSNLDPDPKSPLEDPERILKTRKNNNQTTSFIIQASSSLDIASNKIVSDSEFDKFQHPLFKSKSETDLKELIIDIQEHNKLIPMSFSNYSKELKYQSWDSPTNEVKRKLDYFEESKQSNLLDSLVKKEAQKLSRKSQHVNYIVNPIFVPSKQAPITTTQSVSAMANRYAPLVLPANINVMPVDYSTKIKKFGDDEAYTAR